MNHKTLALVVFILYALLCYGMAFIKPRKCSEHETQDERYKYAVRAPFVAILCTAMVVGITWAVVEAFFQP